MGNAAPDIHLATSPGLSNTLIGWTEAGEAVRNGGPLTGVMRDLRGFGLAAEGRQVRPRRASLSAHASPMRQACIPHSTIPAVPPICADDFGAALYISPPP